MKKKTVAHKNVSSKPRPKRANRSKSELPNKNNGANVQRCKQWLLEQTTIKNKTQPIEDSLDSDESDEFVRIKLEPEDDGPNRNKASRKQEDSVTIYLVCEWQKCHSAMDTYTELIEHVAEHANQMIDHKLATFECQWDLCDFKTSDSKLFFSHCAYHGYHTQIKTVGEQMLLGKKPLPACVNDSRRRNVIAAVKSEYLCMWKDCEFRFGTNQEYYEHVYGHCIFEMKMQRKNGRNGMVQCEWISCKKTFNRQQKMKEHLRSHTGERFLACSNCGSMFNSYGKFYDHYKRQAIENNYKCTQCLRCFATDELLSNHMYNHINCVKCTICDMTCPSPSALAKHFRYRHCKEKPFSCPHCEYRCVTKWDLAKHVTRVHETEKNTYECAEFNCGYTCNSVNLMKKHERDVHDIGRNIYCCHCCDKQYSTGHSLSLHLIKKHGFQLPSGHRRFTYCQDEDGIYRVQTTRMESLEVSEQITKTPSAIELANAKNITFEMSELKANDRGVAIAMIAKHLSHLPEQSNDSDYKEMPNNITPTTSKLADNASDGKESVDITYQIKGEKELIIDDELDNEDHVSFDEQESNLLTVLDIKCLNETETNSSDNGDEMIDDDSLHFTRSTVQAKTNKNSIAIKNIDNFSVMRKYLKNTRSSKKIVITVDELDDQGNVVKTEIQQANEFQM